MEEQSFMLIRRAKVKTISSTKHLQTPLALITLMDSITIGKDKRDNSA
jgi:hypothetical protein